MTDSDIINSLIKEAVDNGTRRAVIKRKENGSPWFIDRAILVPSDFTLIVDDCIVQLAPGVKDNIIRNKGAVPCAVESNRNITIKGKGKAMKKIKTALFEHPKTKPPARRSTPGWRRRRPARSRTGRRNSASPVPSCRCA